MASTFQSATFDAVARPLNVPEMEEKLAREMAALKIVDERSRREAEMVFAQSDELNELKMRIKHAQLNKERSAQICEAQYRQQIEIVTPAH